MFFVPLTVFVWACLFTSARSDEKCAIDAYDTDDLKNVLLSIRELDIRDGDKRYTINFCNPNPAVVLKGRSDTILGKYSESKVEAYRGSNWALIEFTDGDVYQEGNCKNISREALVHIRCDPDKSFTNSAEEHNCRFWFEIGSELVCSEIDKSGNSADSDSIAKAGEGGLSFFSIFFIILIVGIVLYFGIGILYKRIYLDARGWEQLPNSEFWVTVADRCVGCLDRIRYGTGGSSRNDQYYSTLGSDNDSFAHAPPTDDTNDDRLLTM